MKVTVKMFAAARDAVGASEIMIELQEFATVSDIRIALSTSYPQLAPLLSRALFAINAQYANEDSPISTTSEIACIPPVSGG